MKATTKDLRLKTRELIAATDRGEEITITFRGRDRARLVPLANQAINDASRQRNPAFGICRDQASSVAEQIDQMRTNRSFD